MTCSLYEWGALSLHTLLSPATTFVRLPSTLFKYDMHRFSFVLSERERQTKFWRSLGNRCLILVMLPHNLGFRCTQGTPAGRNFWCQKLLQGRHFPSAIENQDYAANGQPIDISTTYGRFWVLFMRSHRRRRLSHWRRGPLVGGLVAGIPLPVSRSLMSVRLHDPLACHGSGSHRPGLRQGPSCQTCLRLLIGAGEILLPLRAVVGCGNRAPEYLRLLINLDDTRWVKIQSRSGTMLDNRSVWSYASRQHAAQESTRSQRYSFCHLVPTRNKPGSSRGRRSYPYKLCDTDRNTNI